MEPNRHQPTPSPDENRTEAASNSLDLGADQNLLDASPLPRLPEQHRDAHDSVDEAAERRSEAGPRGQAPVVDEVVAYLLGKADEETVRRVEAGIEDDGSEVAKYFEAMRRKATGRPALPGDSAYSIRYDTLLGDEDAW